MIKKDKIKRLLTTLQKKKIKIFIAESITGGNFAAELVKLKNASKVLDYSVVCYSNSSKLKFLNIDKEIKEFGVVSKEIAELMAQNISQFSSHTNLISISCTGQAGPTRLNANYDIGTVFIGIVFKKKKKTVKKNIEFKNRTKVIETVTEEMIDLVLNTIKD